MIRMTVTHNCSQAGVLNKFRDAVGKQPKAVVKTKDGNVVMTFQFRSAKDANDATQRLRYSARTSKRRVSIETDSFGRPSEQAA